MKEKPAKENSQGTFPKDYREDYNKQTLRVYEAEYLSFLERWEKTPYTPPRLLLELRTLIAPPTRILDLGCGGGQDTRYLRREGYRVIGLDLSQKLLAQARTQSGGTPLVRANLLRLPLKNEILGAVWSAAVLIHFPKIDLLKILRVIRLSLQTNGVFAGTFTFGTQSGIAQGGWIPGRFFSRWRKNELAGIIQHAGFNIEKLVVVSNRERKGRWLNLIARKRNGNPPQKGGLLEKD